ncbi:MAG TPA: hypothetical protein VGY48_09715 [Vicinamibacterales bacterium]|jgi:hypothetical protein|nr:hypothetical protein [Vicinamibacterales bacterium]
MFTARRFTLGEIVKFFSISGDEKAKLQSADPPELGVPPIITPGQHTLFPARLAHQVSGYLVIC